MFDWEKDAYQPLVDETADPARESRVILEPAYAQIWLVDVFPVPAVDHRTPAQNDAQPAGVHIAHREHEPMLSRPSQPFAVHSCLPPGSILRALRKVVNILKVYYDKFMAKLVFKIQPAKEHGRSPIDIIISGNGKKFVATTENTDLLLSSLDKLLKKNKIELESLKDINVEIANGAGLTSSRIVSSISKALRFDLS
jgi:hypothetical protein